MRALAITLSVAMSSAGWVSVTGAAPAGPAAPAEGFEALTSRAEQLREAGDHVGAARAFAAAFHQLSTGDQAGLLGEITVSNAVDDFKLAQAGASDVLALLLEEASLLDRFAANPERTGPMPYGLSEEHARVKVRIVELGRAQQERTEPATPAAAPTSSPSPASPGPAASPRPPSGPSPATPRTTPEPTPEPEHLSLRDERHLAGRSDAFRRHALGLRSGIAIIPSWVLSRWAASHTNALCRGSSPSAAAVERGLVRQDGCNAYVGAEYAHRFSRVIDVRASVQLQRVALPGGLWLDRRGADGSVPSLATADYTEVDLGLLAMEVDFVARAPVVVTDHVELGLGGGAGLGLGVVLGRVHRTPLGADPRGFTPSGGVTDTCHDRQDLADLTRCTPYASDQDAPPGASERFATCTATECSERELRALGTRREQGSIPPVVPVVSLILGARLIIEDLVGITLEGGFGAGFYVGGGLQCSFGPARADEAGRRASGRRRRSRVAKGAARRARASGP